MTDPRYLLAIDQGTSSSRAMIFDDRGQVIAKSQQEFPQYYPKDGWVEHDGREIIRSVMDCIGQVLDQLPEGVSPLAMGITNQRETTLIWDRKTGEPIYPAIVWQDRRTAELCRRMTLDGVEDLVTSKTGLLLDPYFSATKIKWILDNVPEARVRAEQGELAFGTVDSFVLWHLTGGRRHSTDVTNASRTLLFNIHKMQWDKDLLKLFDVPEALLPDVFSCDHHFGDMSLGGRTIPITAIAGDQQAALIGHNCFAPGQVKCTFGTGGFVMMNTGDRIIRSENRLLTTVAYQIQGRVAYALEGSFFSAGSAVQWLRDGLQIIQSAEETETLARSIESCHGVYMVPAFTGLGAPHWTPDARGTLFGLTRSTGRAEIVRATLESAGFQCADLLDAMQEDTHMSLDSLKVDGGMVANGWLMQFLSDITQLEVVRSQIAETTAYGVALIAGIGADMFGTVNELSMIYRHTCKIIPTMNQKDITSKKNNWKNAVKSTCYHSQQ